MSDDIPRYEDSEEIEAEPTFEDSSSEVANGLQPRDQPMSTSSGEEAIIAGAVEGIPSALIAAGQAVYDQVTTENSVETISESYNRNKTELNRSIDEAKAKHPMVAGAVDMTLSAAGMLLTGGETKAARVAIGVAEGALTGAARVDKPLSKEGLVGALGGGTIGLLGPLAMDGATAMVRKIPFDKAFSSMKTATKTVAIGATTPTQRKALSNFLNTTGQSVDGFLDKMISMKTKSGKLFNGSDTAGEMLEKADMHSNTLSKNVSNLAKGFDEKVSTSEAYRKIKSEIIDPLLNSSDPDLQKVGNKFLREWLDPASKKLEAVTNDGATSHVYTEFLPDAPISKVMELVSDMGRSLGKENMEDTTRSALKLKSSELLHNLVRDTVKGSKKIDPSTIGRFLKDSDELHNINMIKSLLGNSVHKGGGDVLTKVQDALNVKAFVAMQAGKGVGMSDFGATTVAMTLNSALRSKRAPMAVATGFQALVDISAKFPSHNMWADIITAAGVSDDVFRKSISAGISKASFLDNPLPRTVEALKVNRSAIVSMVREKDDNSAAALDKIYDHGDDKELAKAASAMFDEGDDELKQYIEEGVGIDGKVYSDSAKAFMSDNIQKMDAPLIFRLQSQKALMEDGTIPSSPQEFIQQQELIKQQEKKRSFIEGKQGPRY